MTDRDWKKLRKQLPHNWRMQLIKMLENKGLSINVHKIDNIRRRRIKDETLTIIFWKTVHQLKTKHQKALGKIDKLKKGV